MSLWTTLLRHNHIYTLMTGDILKGEWEKNNKSRAPNGDKIKNYLYNTSKYL